MTSATISAGDRNRQTETPAARATTSSSRRERFKNAIIDPSSTANGKACSATIGVCRSDSHAISKPLAPGVSPVRRSVSTRSIVKMRKKTPPNTARTVFRKLRPK